MKKKNLHFKFNRKKILYGVALIFLAAFFYFGTGLQNYFFQTNVAGFSLPVNPNGSSFGCNPSSSSWSNTVWCSSYGSTYESHVAAANEHAGVIVMFKRTPNNGGGFGTPFSGDFYVTGSYGSSATGKNGVVYNAGSFVKCPAGASMKYHSSSHHKYSPSLGEGYYDGDPHYWCDLNGTGVDPEKLDGKATGVQLPDSENINLDKLYRITFSDGTVKYKKIGDYSYFYKCSNGYEGPYEPGVNQYLNSYHVKETAKKPYYHCLSPDGAGFEAAVADGNSVTVGGISHSVSKYNLGDAKNCSSDYVTCQPSCAAGDATCGGAGTFASVFQSCASNTYICQTTNVDTRYCAPTVDSCNFTPPGPAFTLGDATGVKLHSSNNAKTTFETDETFRFDALVSATGTWKAGSWVASTLKVSTKPADFSSPVWQITNHAMVNAPGQSHGATYNGDNKIPPGGPYYFCVEMSMWNDGKMTTDTDGARDQKTKCVLSADTFSVIADTSVVTVTPKPQCGYNSSCNVDAYSGCKEGVRCDETGGQYFSCIPSGFTCAQKTTPKECGLNQTCLSNWWCKAGLKSCANAANGTITCRDTNTACDGTVINNTNNTDTENTVNTVKGCASGEICASGSWCNNGRKCNYPDSSITCVDWRSSCPAGTKVCSANDTKCIEPGGYGLLDGWCQESMECFTADGKQKYCQPHSNDPAKMSVCPADMKTCSPNDSKCIEAGKYGPSDGWCKNAKECYVGDQKYCAPWTMNGAAECPANSTVCPPGDTKCIAPGKSGALDGWCYEGMSCYNEAGTKKYCVSWKPNQTPAGTMMSAPAMNVSCPAEFPKECAPSDKYCIEKRQTGPENGWCSGGAQQCFVKGGIYCAPQGESCPAGSGVCRAGESKCIEPLKSGPVDGWCGGHNSVQCYSDDGKSLFCQQVSGTADPFASETATCPAKTSRCRPDDKFCLELGETGGTGSWCVSGFQKWNDDGSVTCVSRNDFQNMPNKTSPEQLKKTDEDVCAKVVTPAYNPATNECQNYSSLCKVPPGWKKMSEGKVCQDGRVTELDKVIEGDDGLKLMIKNELKFLERLEYQLKDMPEQVKDGQILKQKIVDAKKKLTDVGKMLPFKNQAEREKMKSSINTYHTVDKAEIEAKMAELQPYFDLFALKSVLQPELLVYEKELEHMDENSETYLKLSEIVSKISALLDSAGNMTGQSLSNMVSSIKLLKSEADALIQGRRQVQTGNFFNATIESLIGSAVGIADFIAREGISDFKIKMAYDKYAGLVENIKTAQSNNEQSRLIKLIDEAVAARERVENWLAGYGYAVSANQSRYNIQSVFDHLEKEVARKVEEIVQNVQVVLNQKLQELVLNIGKIMSDATNKIVADIESEVVTSINNLIYLVEEKRDKIIESKKQIIESIDAIETALQNANIGTFTAQRIREAMKQPSVRNWCGRYGEEIQTQINTIGLAVETDRVENEDIADFEEYIGTASAANDRECYETGAQNFIMPSHEWYFGPAEYNYRGGVNSLMHGYFDERGNRTGYFGEANPTLRIEALAMILRLTGLVDTAQSSDNQALLEPVPGVPAWGIEYINAALEQSIDWDWTRDMSLPITRIEAADLLTAVMENQDLIEKPAEFDQVEKYSDYETFAADYDAALAVEVLTDAGIFKGSSDSTGNFYPYDFLLRSEFAAMNQRIDRFIQ